MTNNSEEIEILEVDKTSKQMGFMFYEIGPDGKLYNGTNIDDHYQPEKYKATDAADQYKNDRKKYDKPNSIGYTIIPVLQFLNGKPWDNMALNFVASLRPSSIRVTPGEITSDARTWRVTVFTESDGRTIREIEQEVQVGLHGIRNGQDASFYMRNLDIIKHQTTILINSNAITK